MMALETPSGSPARVTTSMAAGKIRVSREPTKEPMKAIRRFKYGTTAANPTGEKKRRQIIAELDCL